MYIGKRIAPEFMSMAFPLFMKIIVSGIRRLAWIVD